MSFRMGLLHLDSPKVEISSQIQQQSLPCQWVVLVGETALKQAFEVVERSKNKSQKVPHIVGL